MRPSYEREVFGAVRDALAAEGRDVEIEFATVGVFFKRSRTFAELRPKPSRRCLAMSLILSEPVDDHASEARHPLGRGGHPHGLLLRPARRERRRRRPRGLDPRVVGRMRVNDLAFDAQERQKLCDLFDELGPSAATLLDGWTAHDLAAHLVLRERDLVAAPCLVLPGPFQRFAEQRRVSLVERRAFPWLVARIRSGPPPGFFRIGWVRSFPNLNEFFVHHEDVRRANAMEPAHAHPGAGGRVVAQRQSREPLPGPSSARCRPRNRVGGNERATERAAGRADGSALWTARRAAPVRLRATACRARGRDRAR